MKKRVVVLGTTGMLGSMVFEHLKKNSDLTVSGTTRETLDAERFARGETQFRFDADYVINCIGVIKPFCKDNDAEGVRRAIHINALFPHRLASEAKRAGARVIQIATDCVYSGTKGSYTETDAHDALDVYGKTKSLGEVFDRSLLNIRCSIIGPEIKNKVSLLEWFLGQPAGSELKGFSHHVWNGVTTLQFAKVCERILSDDKLYDGLLTASPTHHFVPNTTVTKFELLKLMNRAFKRDYVIQDVNNIGPSVDRTLSSNFRMLGEIYPALTMEAALNELAANMNV